MLRIRVLPLPRDQFMLIMDGVTQEFMDSVDTTAYGDFLRENLDGCGGALLFHREVGDVDMDLSPYG